MQVGNIILNWGAINEIITSGTTATFAQPYNDNPPIVVIGSTGPAGANSPCVQPMIAGAGPTKLAVQLFPSQVGQAGLIYWMAIGT